MGCPGFRLAWIEGGGKDALKLCVCCFRPIYFWENLLLRVIYLNGERFTSRRGFIGAS